MFTVLFRDGRYEDAANLLGPALKALREKHDVLDFSGWIIFTKCLKAMGERDAARAILRPILGIPNVYAIVYPNERVELETLRRDLFR